MQIIEQISGSDSATNVRTMIAYDGTFNNKNIYDADDATGWGCVNDEMPDLVTSCRHNHLEYLRDGNKNDW